jgi:sulfur-oxidizing protein SoxY
MAPDRRELLQWASLLFLGVVSLAPRRASAADEARAFAAGTLDDVIGALGGQPADSPQLSIAVPEFVENGALVPVEIESRLPGAQTIFVVSESNPYPLVARFSIPEGTEPFVSTRIKVGASCRVFAIVRAGADLYWASRPTRVTVGGCGG